MATFTFKPSVSTTSKVRTRIKKVQFGDGYMQRGTDGINTVIRDWNLVFDNISDNDAASIEQFLSDNIGAAITWTPPGSLVAYKYICIEWNRSYTTFNTNNLTLPFEQVFE